jgi:hypothetical protein
MEVLIAAKVPALLRSVGTNAAKPRVLQDWAGRHVIDIASSTRFKQ